MYHKVLIRTENRKFQSILYRSDRSEDIRIRYSHLHYRVCIISSYTHIARNRNPMRQKLRLLVGVDKWEAQLLCAKSKVTSFRSISFPGLELCGVLLFTQLMLKINKDYFRQWILLVKFVLILIKIQFTQQMENLRGWDCGKRMRWLGMRRHNFMQ